MSSQPSKAVTDATDLFTAPDGRGKYSVINRRKLAALMATKGEHANLDINLMLRYLAEQGVLKDENLAEPTADSFFVMKLSDPSTLAAVRAYTKSVFEFGQHTLAHTIELVQGCQSADVVVSSLDSTERALAYGCDLLQLMRRIEAIPTDKMKFPD